MLPQAYGRTAQARAAAEPAPDRCAVRRRQQEQQESEKLELEARLTFSSREMLSRMDFDTMSAAELVEAKKMLVRGCACRCR